MASRRRVTVEKAAGEPLGAEVASALFDQVRTCDNHCEFCFIYQLPPGLRRSLYLKDDDYRLSFLYGNFTTLTRFTEADLERVIDEGLSPLNVSIHATDPERAVTHAAQPAGRHQPALAAGPARPWRHRARPGRGVSRASTTARCWRTRSTGVLDQYPELATLCVVPLGVSRFNREAAMRPHTTAEAAAVVDTVHEWQDVLPRRPRAAAGVRCGRVLPAGRPSVPGRRGLRGLSDARGRRGHGPHVRARVHGPRHGGGGRAERVLRLGGRCSGRRVPRAPEPGRGIDRPAGGGGAGPGCDRPSRCCRRGGHRSGC